MAPKIMKIAFITWDGIDANYLENLFLPIFFELKQKYQIEFHVIQFSWLATDKVIARKQNLNALGFHYKYFHVHQGSMASITKFGSLFFAKNKVQKYLNDNLIDVVMPRSTMPALLVLLLNTNKRKIIFDADGLPLIERIEFSGLKSTSVLLKILTFIEKKIVKKADKILTRSQFASTYLSEVYKKEDKFFTEVVNGKDPNLFHFSESKRLQLRQKLGFLDTSIVFIYCGSVGGKYRLDEMFLIFQQFNLQNSDSFFVILTQGQVPDYIKNHKCVYVKSVTNNDVPDYLSAADIGLGLIKETTSMKAAAAIKYSEYLMCGLPVILSNVGDILKLTTNQTFVLHYNQSVNSNIILDFVLKNRYVNRSEISKFANQHFSVDAASNSYYQALTCLSK